MKTVSEREQIFWMIIATSFENTPATNVIETLYAEGYISIDEIRKTYFEVVAPGMSLLHVTNKNRLEPFSRQEILEACFQFYRPRFIRPLVQLFGKYICRKAGDVLSRWQEWEEEFSQKAEA